MRKTWYITLLAATLLCACQKESFPTASLPHGVSECTFACEVPPLTPQTRSNAFPSSFNDASISGATLAAYNAQTGSLYASAHFTGNFGEMTLPLETGTAYYVYALVNMGDRTSVLPSTRSGFDSFTYSVPSYQDVASKGLPMSGMIPYTPGVTASGAISLSRLFAKVTLNVTLGDFNGGTAGGVVINSLRLYNGNGVLAPYGQSAMTASSQAIGAYDYETLASPSGTASTVFYAPENRQGEIGSATSSRYKNPDTTPAIAAVQDLLTYVEVDISASSAYYTGTLKCRSYIGSNATTNFDVKGNHSYTWNLTITEDGLAYDDWKEEQDITDNRQLSLLNPIYVEPGDIVPWSGVITSNILLADLGKTFSGQDWEQVVASSGSTSFTVQAGATAGMTAELQVSPLRNPKASLTKDSQVRVVDKTVSWEGYDASVYSSENRKVYAVLQGQSVDAQVKYSFLWAGAETRLPGECPSAWTYTAEPSEGVSSAYTAGSATVLDKVTYTVPSDLAPGDYAITVSRTGGHTGQDVAYLRVSAPTYYVLKAEPATVSLAVGGQQALVAKVYTVTNGIISPTGETVAATWSVVSGGAVASVGQTTGVVTALSSGTATITASATYGGQTLTLAPADYVTVSVSDSITTEYELVISPETATLVVGHSRSYTAVLRTWTVVNGVRTTYSDTALQNSQITWQSSSACATISAGTVTGVSAGTATITATYAYSGQNLTDTASLTVIASGGGAIDDGWDDGGTTILN